MSENQFETNYQSTTPLYKNASYFRTRARELLKGKWGDAILIGFLALILGAVILGSFNFNFDFEFSDFDTTEIESFEFTLNEATWKWIGNLLLVGVLTVGISTFLYSTFVAAPIKLGYQRVNLDLVDGKPIEVKTLFSYFKLCYLKSVKVNALYWLATSLIALIPFGMLTISVTCVAGDLFEQFVAAEFDFSNMTFVLDILFKLLPILIVAFVVSIVTAVISSVLTYMYRFSYMVLAEYPHMGALEAMRISRTMMKGNKWRLFCLDFSFIGWFILAGLFTCGLGAIAIYPYREAAFAAFYDDIAHRNAAKETEFPSLDFDDYMAEEDSAEPNVSDSQPESEEEMSEESSAHERMGGMPFTAELEFPSLDLDDYSADEESERKNTKE